MEMNAYAELRTPAHYADMSQEEMWYDGGLRSFYQMLHIVSYQQPVSHIQSLEKESMIHYCGAAF